MDFLNEVGAWLTQNRELVFRWIRVAFVVSTILGSAVAIGTVLIFPVRIRFGMVRLDPLLKLICMGLIIGWMVLTAGVVINSTLVVIAKYLLLNVMIAVSVMSWVFLLTWPQISRALSSIQQECELATNLTYLQAEMARAQLEQLNDRIQRSIEPEEREVTETMLKTLSPLVTMFIRRERSVLKWSVAAVDVGKTLMGYFFSDKK
jgi:hypothetical protein